MPSLQLLHYEESAQAGSLQQSVQGLGLLTGGAQAPPASVNWSKASTRQNQKDSRPCGHREPHSFFSLFLVSQTQVA